MNGLTNEEKKYLAMGIEEDERTGGKITCQYPEKETVDIVTHLSYGGRDEAIYLNCARKLAIFWKNYFEVSPEFAKEEQRKEYEQAKRESEEFWKKYNAKKHESALNFLSFGEEEA